MPKQDWAFYLKSYGYLYKICNLNYIWILSYKVIFECVVLHQLLVPLIRNQRTIYRSTYRLYNSLNSFLIITIHLLFISLFWSTYITRCTILINCNSMQLHVRFPFTHELERTTYRLGHFTTLLIIIFSIQIQHSPWIENRSIQNWIHLSFIKATALGIKLFTAHQTKYFFEIPHIQFYRAIGKFRSKHTFFISFWIRALTLMYYIFL